MPPRETVPADDQEAAGSNGAEHDGTPSVPVTDPPGVPTCPPRRRTSLVSCRTHPLQPPGPAAQTFRRPHSWRPERMGRQTADGAERTARSAPAAWQITFHARIADRSGIPPVRAGRSGGPVQVPEAVRLQTGRWALPQRSRPVT